jgi:hypothetical protein
MLSSSSIRVVFPAPLLLCLGLSLPSAAQQQLQPALDDVRIMQLVQDGVHSDELQRIIASAPTVAFLMNPASTDVMLKAGVSEDVLKAMSARTNGVGGSTVGTSAATIKTRSPVTPTSNTAFDGKPRVFVEPTPNRLNGYGSHPQLAEVMKTLGHSCPGIVVTNDKSRANYVVTFEREAHKIWRKDNKIAVFNSSGDMVFSSSTRVLGNDIRSFCSHVL